MPSLTVKVYVNTTTPADASWRVLFLGLIGDAVSVGPDHPKGAGYFARPGMELGGLSYAFDIQSVQGGAQTVPFQIADTDEYWNLFTDGSYAFRSAPGDGKDQIAGYVLDSTHAGVVGARVYYYQEVIEAHVSSSGEATILNAPYNHYIAYAYNPSIASERVQSRPFYFGNDYKPITLVWDQSSSGGDDDGVGNGGGNNGGGVVGPGDPLPTPSPGRPTIISPRGLAVPKRRGFSLAFSNYALASNTPETQRSDFSKASTLGFSTCEAWATWMKPDSSAQAILPDGTINAPRMQGLLSGVAVAQQAGVSVGVRMWRGALDGHDAHVKGLQALCKSLKHFRGGAFYLDVDNETHLDPAELNQLLAIARRLLPRHQVSVSLDPGGRSPAQQAEFYNSLVNVSLFLPHFDRDPGAPEETQQRCIDFLGAIRAARPLLYLQEEFRDDPSEGRDFTPEDRYTALAGAVAGGAVGWCFHTESPYNGDVGFFASLTAEETEVVNNLGSVLNDSRGIGG